MRLFKKNIVSLQFRNESSVLLHSIHRNVRSFNESEFLGNGTRKDAGLLIWINGISHSLDDR